MNSIKGYKYYAAIGILASGPPQFEFPFVASSIKRTQLTKKFYQLLSHLSCQVDPVESDSHLVEAGLVSAEPNAT